MDILATTFSPTFFKTIFLYFIFHLFYYFLLYLHLLFYHKWVPMVTMEEEEAFSRNDTRVRLYGNNIKIPVPLPNILRCVIVRVSGVTGLGQENVRDSWRRNISKTDTRRERFSSRPCMSTLAVRRNFIPLFQLAGMPGLALSTFLPVLSTNSSNALSLLKLLVQRSLQIMLTHLSLLFPLVESRGTK